MTERLFGAVFLLAASLCACSGEKKADAAMPARMKEGSVAPRPTVVSTPAAAYRATAVSGGGRMSGTVDFGGVFPPDTVIQLAPDLIGCGQKITDHRVDHAGTRVNGAIVWIDDIRSGKPLPVARRFELVNEDCMITPKVQAVVAPATLNLVSEDVALHRNRVINVGTGELEAIAPFNDNGEVVPYDRLLDRTEQLEVACEMHPWSKAWVLVFDNPYFAITEKGGAFSIDDVPPGTYHVKAWHPLLGVSEQTITVSSGRTANVAFNIPGAPAGVAAAAAAPSSDSGGR